jgi:bacterioferritin-associated ferredoxin
MARKMTLNFIFIFCIIPREARSRTVIICHCYGISERAIRKAVRGGASTRREVAHSCKAGQLCGGCGPAVDEILASEEIAEATTASPALTHLAASAG